MNQNLRMDRDWNSRGSCKLRRSHLCHPEEFTDSCIAVEFLLVNRFSIDAVCQHGVHYLSRDEEIRARNIQDQNLSNNKQDQGNDIEIVDQSIQTFLTAVRVLIDKWIAQGEVSFLIV